MMRLKAWVSSSTSASSSLMSDCPLSAQTENSCHLSSHPALWAERLATIVARAAPSAPIYADMVPPPGAALSRLVSSANALTVALIRRVGEPALCASSIRYSITFSRALNGFRSSSPIDLTAILMMSSSGMPVERCCFSRKYFPASMSVRLGTSPTISVPVTRMPRLFAQRHTSSKAT